MTSPFDSIIVRRHTGSIKWDLYPEDVLPLWVADADFQSPSAVIEALRERADHGVFGYQGDDARLRDVLVARLADRHQLAVQREHIIFLPGLVAALNVVARTFTDEGRAVMLTTPSYPPFLISVKNAGRTLQDVPLASSVRDGILHYEIDFDALHAAVTPATQLFMLCNPHNPVGRVFTRAELETLAEFVLTHNLIVCSDEIHCDLLLDEAARHISFAALGPEIAARTITLMAPSKTFNIPGLGLGFAVVADDDLRARMMEPVMMGGLHAGVFGFTGALAAYMHGEPWLRDLLAYLRGNRDFAVDFLRTNLPHIPVTVPEATYLLWLDLRAHNLEPNPAAWLVEHAKIGLNDGGMFGDAGTGFVRLNFACPRATLTEALERLHTALSARPAG